MKKIYRSLFALALATTFFTTSAQVTGVKNIPVDYPTIQAAIADLNLVGVGVGGATINIPAGTTETFTSQVVLTMTSNPSSQANPLVFRKNGAGLNPVITAFSPGVSTTVDGIFILNGVDYVTIDGIDLQDNVANTTPTQLMEWGYALVKVSGVDACQYNAIKNCSVTLSNVNPSSTGIYIGNHTFLSNVGLVVTNIGGTSSNNKFYNNTIDNCYIGYSFTGFTSAAPYDFYDQSNVIGVDGISTRRSQVVRFGGAATAANGVFSTNQNGIKIHSTYINNTGAPNSTGILNGISLGAGLNSNVDIYNDTITVVLNGTTSQLAGINNTMGGTGAGNTINIYNNVVDGCTYPTATSAIFRGIFNSATSTYRNIYNNKVTNNSIPSTGEFSCIYDAGSSITLVLNLKIYNNLVNNNTKTGTAGTFNSIYASASSNLTSIYTNTVSNNNSSASSGAHYGYYNFAVGANEVIYDNLLFNNTGGTGETVMLFARTGSGPTNKDIFRNTIYNISGTANFASVGGIWTDYATIANVYRNNIYNITNNTTTGATPAVYGINIGSNVNTQYNINNNFISDLKAPNANNANAVYGMWLQGNATSYLGAYYNSIYLNASSTGLNFGSAAIVCGIAPFSIDLRNNILANNSTPNGTGTTKALVRGNAILTNYNTLSGYNCLYAGSPSASNLIFFDGTNSVQILQGFKNLVGSREQTSFSSLPPFVNVATTPYDLHLQNSVATQCEGGGTPVVGITNDYDNALRNATTPDVGADEIAGITSDIASPNIQYPLLTNSPVAANKNLTAWATISDPSGVNTTAGTKPRLYYKKTTEANTYVGNTAADNGWKYVEATNAASPFDFNINYALLTGGSVIGGDIIQYFVTAQDLATTPNIGLNNGGFAAQPVSVNLSATEFPLANTINQYVIVTNAYSGTVNVGPTEIITSLTNPGGMFDLINQGVLNGNTALNITGDLTLETGAIALNQWAEDGVGNYSLTIQPSAAITRTVTGPCTIGSLVRFNGADRVKIDGRFNNVGMYLLFRNTGAHSSVGYVNDAQNNILQYSIIESGNQLNTAVAGGAVIIGTTSAMYGNDNITISDCEIRDRSDIAGTPAWGINCNGTAGMISQYNNNIVIKNNNVHDYFINANFAHGILFGVGNSSCTISNNSLYHTVPKTYSLGTGSMRGIFVSLSSPVNNTGGYTITNNYIGGNTPLAAGDMTINVSGTVYTSFIGLLVSTGQIPNYIEGNVIRNIDFTTNAPTANATIFNPIQAANGIHSVGTLTGNVIGIPNGTGSIKININTGGASSAFLAGIFAVATNGSYAVRNNTIGGITIGGTNTTGAIIPQWIQSQGTPAQNLDVSNNVIGSVSTPSSIINNMNAPSIAFAIRHLVSTGPAISITSNTIMNIVDNSNSASSQHYGFLLIGSVGTSGPMNVSNNLIRNISSNALPLTPVITNFGIACQGMAGTHTLEANTISGIACVNPGAGAAYALGIQTQGSSFGGIMRKNYINNITNAQTGVGAGIGGIYITAGNNWDVSNNMISLSNGANTNTLDVYGIGDFMGIGANLNLNYNSVYIGGSSPTGTVNSYAFYRGGIDNVKMRNNLLYNERAGSTASHVAIGTFTTQNWGNTSSNYNAFLTSDTTRLAIWSGTVTTFNGWKGFTLGDNNSQKNITTSITAGPLFVNVGLGDLHINTSTYPGGLASPISITTDIDNNSRSATFPAVGADEIPCPVPIIAVVSQSNTLCFGSNEGLAIITATGGLSHTYSWSPVSSTTNSITNLTAGNYTIQVTNHCSLTGSLVVIITQPSSIIPVATQTNVTCFSYSNGIAALNPTGGTPGYTYSWSPSNSTSSSLTAITAGVHNYTITDANGCKISNSVTITEPFVVNASGSSTSACGSQSTGVITTTAFGGTPGYTYSWSPNVSSTGTVMNVPTGTYTLYVTDANSCTMSPQVYIVGTNPSPTVSAGSSTNIICLGSSASLTANGSAGATYSWSSGGTSTVEVVFPSTNTIYTVVASFTNGCKSSAAITVSVSPCTGIAKLTGNAGIQVYPNPNNGMLFVTYIGYTENSTIEVYNTLGQLLITKKVEGTATQLNLNNYANGVYIVKVLSNKNTIEQVTKLIKE